MSQCPYCDFECAEVALEIEHMNTRHPEIIAERLAQIGEEMTDPFEGHGVKETIPRPALMIIATVATALNQDPEIVIFPGIEGVLGPWICFNIGERKFGIWTATMHLYEGDEHGAMGTDILNPATVTKT
jgi:hypothetical protein